MEPWQIILIAGIVTGLIGTIWGLILNKFKSYYYWIKKVEKQNENIEKEISCIKEKSAERFGELTTIIEQKFTLMIEAIGEVKKDADKKFVSKEFYKYTQDKKDKN